MRAVVQRVSRASVAIDGAEVGAIGPGLLVLLGVAAADQAADSEWLVQKIAALRIFADPEGHMNLSVRDVGAGALVVSQFTLLASTRKGARPSFHAAARPEVAAPLYEDFLQRLKLALGRDIPTGRFGAMMEVALVNDGPVTLVLDSQLKE